MGNCEPQSGNSGKLKEIDVFVSRGRKRDVTAAIGTYGRGLFTQVPRALDGADDLLFVLVRNSPPIEFCNFAGSEFWPQFRYQSISTQPQQHDRRAPMAPREIKPRTELMLVAGCWLTLSFSLLFSVKSLLDISLRLRLTPASCGNDNNFSCCFPLRLFFFRKVNILSFPKHSVTRPIASRPQRSILDRMLV